MDAAAAPQPIAINTSLCYAHTHNLVDLNSIRRGPARENREQLFAKSRSHTHTHKNKE
jgi:hypothetical protein